MRERRRSTFTVGMEVSAWAAVSAPLTDTTVSAFLLDLLGGKEYVEADAVKLTIRNPAALRAIFSNIVGVLEEAAQVQVLDALINLVRSSCGNVEACSSFGLQRDILTFLSERGLFVDPFVSNQVLKKVLRLFLYLANHSVSSDDICAMLAVFRSPRMEHEDPDDQAVSYYIATLEMIARDSFGPVSFFDLSGDYSGLVLPVLESFPANGYTFCAWLKFECLPETSAPLFTFCGKTDVGIVCSFIRSSLAITCFDKKKNDSHVEIPDLITPGRWHFLSIVHTHRQIRGSKVDIFLNGELRHSTKLTYPNTVLMAPVVKSYIAMRDRDRGTALKVLLGPTALFGQPLPPNIISNIKSADEYDALVFQFNSYISSSTSSTSSVTAAVTGTAGVPTPTTGGEGLLFAYDARNCDRQRGLCFDSSGNDNHAEAASAGVRLRRAGTFKQAIAQLGGPLVCLPLLVTAPKSAAASGSNAIILSQFDEDTEFLSQMADEIARPLGPRSIPKVILLMGEIMRHSLVNKFIYRRHQGVRLTALLLRSLPPAYLSPDLLLAIERFRSAVISDRTLAEDIYKHLLFNFRIWVNAPTDLQNNVFEKLEVATRKDGTTSSAVSTRHFLRCLSWIYWRQSHSAVLRRVREFTEDEINVLRRRVLEIIKLELCEAQPIKTSVIGRGAKAKEVKTQLSYESTRSLIFCMIGKPTNPMSSGLNADGTPSLQDAGEVANNQAKNMSDGEADAGSVVENVPEADLPDLIELLIELSLQPTAPAGLLDLFGRLGGLRIWLPLLNFSYNTLRVMTLRLLRTYLTLKCQCVQDREKVTSLDKIQLSVGDAFLIMRALNAAGHPVTMGVYSEILLLLLGFQVTEHEMKPPGTKSEDYESLIDETMLSGAMIWHANLLFPFLEMVRASSPSIRLVAIRHLKILFASSTPASAINRNMLIFNSISTSGALTISSTTEQTPIIEAMLSLRGDQKVEHPLGQLPSSLFGVPLTGCPGVTLSRLREIVLSPTEGEETRINALFSIMASDDAEFVSSLFTVSSEGDRKKNTNGAAFRDMPNRVKMAAIELMSHLQPAACATFITQTAYELISSIVCLEAKSNDMAWILLQDPFTSLSRFIDSSEELEIVVITLLRSTLDKMNELLTVELNLRGKEDSQLRDSVLWRNAENLATLAAAVVLHYDPDTLGSVKPDSIEPGSDSQNNPVPVYWRCERMMWHEAELVDSLLGVWQHLAPYFHSEKDASFGRKPARSIALSLTGPSAPPSGSQSPPPVGAGTGPARRDSRNGVNRGMGFGFNILAAPGSQGGQGTVAMRPHPGGPMRQVLQLLLRSFYIILLTDDRETAEGNSSNNVDGPKLKIQASSTFLARINKLEYFVNAMGLGRDTSQYESSFTPSRSSTNIGIGGLITSSNHVRAAPGDETSLVLWFVPELAALINRVRRKLWSDSAVKLASILAGLVMQPLRSSEELIALLNQNDFASSNQEVSRRDGFYFEQMAHARESRANRRTAMLTHEVEEKDRARAELERIGRSTRTPGNPDANGSTDETTQVWLQRMKAKDVDDWMRLRVLLKWGIRHVWSNAFSVTSSGATELVSTNGLSEALNQNEFWRLDTYTSSNWIRSRLLPDTDDTLSDYAEYVKSISSLSNGINASNAEVMEAFSASNEGVIKAMTDDSNGDRAEEGDEEQDEDLGYDADDVVDSVMDALNGYSNDGDSGSGGESSPTRNSASGPGRRVRAQTGGIMGGDRNSLSVESKAPSSAPTDLTAVPIESPAASTTSSGEQDKVSDRLDSIIDTPDVASSVKGKDKFGRIGTISSRFSTGIRMLTGVKKGDEDKTAEAAAAIGAPRLWRRQSGQVQETTPPEPAPRPETPVIVVPPEETVPSTVAVEADKTDSTGNAATPPSLSSSRVTRGFQARSEQWRNLGALYRTKAYLILPSGLMVYGILRIGSTTIVFEGEYVTTLKKLSELTDDSKIEVNLGNSFVSELRRRVWGVRVIRVIYRRRFLLNPQNGIEVYFVDGSSCFLGLEGNDEADLVYATLKERKPPCLAKWGKRLLTADRMFNKSKWTEMWVRREISNFEYLMLLNVSAGRTYNDLTQYPVFPWVLQDYVSEQLRLDDPSVYRDLTKPIGVQTATGSQRARDLYQSWKADSQIPAHHFPTSYSHLRSVFFFLCRLAPFTNALAINGQNADSILSSGGAFNSIGEAFNRATDEDGCQFELVPEFFFLPEFLVSSRNKQLMKGLGVDQNTTPSLRALEQSVSLPPWATSPHDFIRQHRLALESDYVSDNLHHWIDLIFGYKQQGQAAIDAENSYHIACQPERLELNSLNVGTRARLTQRGTLPIQLFKKPHPARMSQDDSLEARFSASHAMAALSSRRQVRRHDLNSKHSAPVVQIRFASALNSSSGLGGPGMGSGTGIGAHSSGSNDHGVVVYTSDSEGTVLAKRYLNSTPDQPKMCPFTLADVDQWWKLPTGSLVRDGVVFYEQMISCGYWDGSWRIHWSADGELLQRIAFHKKPILCMACSEDDFTGDLALAFGSEDCTVSVWALSKLAATRSRRMFVKKELPVGGLPWVLLHGHTNPVVAVALNVDLDIVVSSSRDNTILVHSLRSATPLHNIEIASPAYSVVTHLTISSHGDTLIHSVANRITLLSGQVGSFQVDHHDEAEQSDLYLVSMNGQLVSHDRLETTEGKPVVLLDRGVFFTRSGEYIITATGGADGVIEVRDAGLPSVVVRRIECKRNSNLTTVSVSQDERCILCGYADGAVVAYALHYGISDGCKNISNLDRKAREDEAEAMAKANLRDQLKKEAEEKKNLFRWGASNADTPTGLWIRAGKIAMPEEPYLSAMQDYYSWLKQPCVTDNETYELLRKELWTAMYGRDGASELLDLGDTQLQYEQSGPTWSRLGFQRPDPTTDFRAGGQLSLKCLVYFAKHYYDQAARMVEHQVPGSHENTYPWGPAGINVTCVLARTFWSGDGCLYKERHMNWPFFADKDAFYVIFSEVFLLFDHLWEEMNAHYGAFSEVMQATTRIVLEALEEAKADLSSFLIEIRAQSLSNSGRKGRAASRSMEEFVVNMSSSIVSPQFISRSSFGSTRNSFMSVSDDVFAVTSSVTPPAPATTAAPPTANLLDFNSPKNAAPPAPATSSASVVATSSLANPSLTFDPFAGNNIVGLEQQTRDEDTAPNNYEDPFASLT